MRPVLIILMLFLRNLTFSQVSAETLHEKAYDFYFRNKNIDSALFYYLILQKSYPDHRPGYINYVIGSCYLYKSETDLARDHLLLSLRLTKPEEAYPERASLKLGDIFFKSGNYNKALAYYDSSTSTYRIRNPYGSTHKFKEGNLSTIYKKAICLDKLNGPDTAINILTSYVFLDLDYFIYDSTEAVNLVNSYVSLLKKKYTVKQIRKEFKRAMKKIIYSREIDSFSYQRNPKYKMILIDCYFNFFGRKVDIGGGGIEVKDFNEKTPADWRKKAILEEFHKYPMYKKLKKI